MLVSCLFLVGLLVYLEVEWGCNVLRSCVKQDWQEKRPVQLHSRLREISSLLWWELLHQGEVQNQLYGEAESQMKQRSGVTPVHVLRPRSLMGSE